MKKWLLLTLCLAAAGYGADATRYRIREGRMMGFIDRTGTVVIPPQFDAAEPFSDGMSRVYLGSKAGYINTDGKLVVPARYDTASKFEKGRAIVSEGGKYKVIDKTGATVNEIPYRVLGDYHADLVVVQRQRSTGADGKTIPGAYGYIDRDGRVVIEPRFMPAGGFPDDGGLAVGGLDRQWVYFDRTGKVLISIPMEGRDRADGFHDGLLRVKEGFYWGYKDASGKWSIPAKFDNAGNFEDGVAQVELKGKYIAIDVRGDQVKIAKGPRKVAKASDGLTRAVDGDRMGWLKTDGKPAFPFRVYEQSFDFSCGLARIRLEGRFGFLDKTGELKIPNQYASASDFENCLAMVMTREGWAYIDPAGKEVWRGK